MKKLILALLTTLICFQSAYADAPDFGPEGLKGLSTEDKAALNKGDLIIYRTPSSLESSQIQSVAIFNKTPQQTWDLLYHTERQKEYLEELVETKIIEKERDDEDIIFFKLKFLFIEKNYQVKHNFDHEQFYIHWKLDDGFDNELDELSGFWKLYPYNGGQKTLVRYGSSFTLKGVPKLIQNLFKKSGIKKSLEAVRRWVESDGTYRK